MAILCVIANFPQSDFVQMWRLGRADARGNIPGHNIVGRHQQKVTNGLMIPLVNDDTGMTLG